jgi:hypothetical protein
MWNYICVYIYASQIIHADCVEWRERIENRRVEIECDFLN